MLTWGVPSAVEREGLPRDVSALAGPVWWQRTLIATLVSVARFAWRRGWHWQLKVLRRFHFEFVSCSSILLCYLLPGASMHFSCRQPVGLPVPCQDNKILHPESVVKESPDKSLGHEQMAKSLLYVSTLDFWHCFHRQCHFRIREVAKLSYRKQLDAILDAMSHKRGSKHEQTWRTFGVARPGML